MDPTVLAAFIGALATIISAIIGPMVHWWLQLDTNSIQIRWFRIVVIFQIISVVLLVIGIYFIYTNYLSSNDVKSFAFDFSPAIFDYNLGENYHEKIIYPANNNPDIPKNLPWYELKSGNLVDSGSILINYPINNYLYYESRLNENRWGWTGFSIKRVFPLSPWNLGNKSNLIFIIFAKQADKIEIGIKDKYGRVDKPFLEIKEGWAGYKIPFTEFSGLDWNKIELIQIAHALHLKGKASNIFKLGLLTSI